MGEHQRPKAPPQNDRVPPREEQITSVMVTLDNGTPVTSYCLDTKDTLYSMLGNDWLIIRTGSQDSHTELAEIAVPTSKICTLIISNNKKQSLISTVSPIVKLN